MKKIDEIMNENNYTEEERAIFSDSFSDVLIAINDEPLGMEKFRSQFNIDEKDIMNLASFFDNYFIRNGKSFEEKISLLSKCLGQNDKTIRKYLNNSKLEKIEGIFFKKLFSDKLKLKISSKYVNVTLNDFFVNIKIAFKNNRIEDLITNFDTVENLLVEDPETTSSLALVLLSTTNIKDFKRLLDKCNNDRKKLTDLMIIKITLLLKKLNRYVLKRELSMDLHEGYDLFDNIIKEQKEETDKKIDSLQKENKKLLSLLKEKDELIDEILKMNGEILLNKSVLVIGDSGRKNQYLDLLKRYGLNEKNFYHLDGISECRNTKQYQNIDYVFVFTSQTKHIANQQLKNFSESTKIIWVNRTGIDSLRRTLNEI